MKMKEQSNYEIWLGTFLVQGMDDWSTPDKVGESLGNTFEDACANFYKEDKLYNKERNTYWGCTLHSSKESAFNEYLTVKR